MTNEATREAPTKADLIRRAKAILTEGQQMQDDADHWNRMNPDQEPIALDLSYLEQTREVLRRLEAR
jgi:hypothetical protein